MSLALAFVFALDLTASPLYFTGRLADPASGAAWTGDFSATVALARNADGSGVVTNVAMSVMTDTDGLFGLALPLPVEALITETGDAYLVASFTDGTRQTTLPAQRVGYATCVVHTLEAYAANLTAISLSALTATNFSSVGELTVHESFNVAGTMVITNGVTFAKNGLAALSVDRLNLNVGETRILSSASTAASAVCQDGEVQSIVWTAATDALVTLACEVPETAALLLSVARVGSEGKEESIFGQTLSGEGVRKLNFPACAGDVISISAVSSGGDARLSLAVRTFGVKMEDQ